MISISELFKGLGQNIALLLALTFICGAISPRLRQTQRTVQAIVVGLLFGVIAVIGMLTSIQVSQGVVIDGRVVVVALAGLFGGPISGIIAALMAGAYRIWLGGIGTWPGVGAIFVGAGIGIWANWRWGNQVYRFSFWHFFLLGSALAIQGLLWSLALPAEYIWPSLRVFALPITVLYVLGTYFLGTVFAHQARLLEAEAALQQSEARYRTLFDGVPVGLYQSTPEGHLLETNSAMVQILGYPDKQALLAINTIDLYVNPEERRRWQTELKTKGVVHNFETQARRHDGTTIWVDNDAKQVTNAAGNIFYEGSLQDITGRVQVETAIKNIVIGVSSKIGEKFLESMVKQLAETIGADFTYIAEITGTNNDTVRTLVNCVNGEISENFEYALNHTPCQNVMNIGVCSYPANVAQLFPKDYRLEEMGVNGYSGIALFDSNHQAIGIIVALFRSPISDPKFSEAILQIFAARTAAEIERMRVEKRIRRRNRELTLLNQVIAASTANLETEAVLEAACRELALAYGLRQAIAALLNRDKTVSIVVAEYLDENRPSVLHTSISIDGNPAAQYILTHTTPLVINHAQQEPRLAPVYELIQNRGVSSILLLPLIIEGNVLGHLALETPDAHHFSTDEISLVSSVADQVSGALARTRLTRTHQRLSAAVEQITESVVITDVSETITYVNPAFEKISGYSRAEVIGQSPHILDSGEHDEFFFEDQRDTITSGQVWQGRVTNRKKDGTLYTEAVTISPIRDKSNKIVNFVEVKRDITRELELEEQYLQSQKIDAVGQLTGGIAHDFNNLLTAINGFAELLQMRLPEHDANQRMVANILNAGQNAANLIRQLMAFSRKQIISPEVLNLNDVVTQMGKMLGRIIREDVQTETHLAKNLWYINIDRTQIQQVVVNLAVNARDAMPDGGKLTIETSNVTLDNNYAFTHLNAKPGEYVLLSVSDTGVGMSKETQSHIFEPFFTTKETGKGTGLGLATVFGIVKQNEGDIQVYSELGHGSTFKIYFPHCQVDTSMYGTYQLTDDISGGTETILLVEDESAVRALIVDTLGSHGYVLLETTNGKEALEISQKHHGTIHLLLTDVIMPQMGGKALVEQFMELRPDTKILFMSGYTDEAIVHHGVLDPVVMFLQKPFSSKALLQKVRKAIDSNDVNESPNTV